LGEIFQQSHLSFNISAYHGGKEMIIDEDQQWKLEYLTQEELDLLDTIKTRRYH
jgi:hypothetical protein